MSNESRREYFGIKYGGNFSLKVRLWARLIEKIALMRCERDTSQKNLYRFFGDDGTIIILRVDYLTWEEGSYRVVELLDSKDENNILAKEELFPDGWAGSYSYHPLVELFEIIHIEELPGVEEIQNLARVVQQ